MKKIIFLLLCVTSFGYGANQSNKSTTGFSNWVKKQFSRWTAYEKRMWDCMRGTVTCSKEERADASEWFGNRLSMAIVAAMMPFLAYEARREKERLEQAREEGLRAEKERRKRGELLEEVYFITSNVLRKLERLHNYHISRKRRVLEPSGGPGIWMMWYEILNLRKDASVDEINAQSRKLLLETHPDKGGDVELFDLIRKARNYGLQKEKASAELRQPLLLKH